MVSTALGNATRDPEAWLNALAARDGADKVAPLRQALAWLHKHGGARAGESGTSRLQHGLACVEQLDGMGFDADTLAAALLCCLPADELADDGLSVPWAGHVWLNPPYSDPGPWMERLADHGDGIALVFARTDTGWWHDYVWGRADLLLFVRRRLRFVEPTETPGRKASNAPAPSVLVAYGQWAVRSLRSSGIPGAFALPLRDA